MFRKVRGDAFARAEQRRAGVGAGERRHAPRQRAEHASGSGGGERAAASTSSPLALAALVAERERRRASPRRRRVPGAPPRSDARVPKRGGLSSSAPPRSVLAPVPRALLPAAPAPREASQRPGPVPRRSRSTPASATSARRADRRAFASSSE